MTGALRCFGLGALLALAACQSDINPDNPDAALPYRCVRDGGYSDGGFSDGGDPQCPGDFICGLEGYCHPRTEGKAYLCEGDFDCAPDWRCGVSLNPEVTPTCHPRGVTATYACREDTDCEEPPDGGPRWRCGPQRSCLDPSRDELRRDANYGPMDGGTLGLWPLRQLPQYVAASPSDFGTGSSSVAWVENGNLGFLKHHGRGREVGDGGTPPVFNEVVRIPLNPPVRALEISEDRVYVLDQAGLGDYVWQEGRGLTRLRLIANATGKQLRYIQGFGELPAVYEPSRLTMFRTDGGPSHMLAPPGTPYLDVSGVPSSILQPQARLLSLTDGGIYVRGWDPNAGPTSSEWTAQSIGAVTNTACWDGGSPAITEGYIATSIGETFHVPVGSGFTTEPRIPVVVRPFRADGRCPNGCVATLGTATSVDAGTCMPVPGVPNAVSEGPCPVCDPGSTAVEVRSFLYRASHNPDLTSRLYVVACQRTDGTQYLDFVQLGQFGICPSDFNLPTLPYKTATEEPSNRVGRGLTASAGAHGQLWLWADGWVRAATPPRPPSMLSGGGDNLTAFVGPGINTTYGLTPGAGLLWLVAPMSEARDLYHNQFSALAPIEGRPGWALANLGVVDLRRVGQGNMPLHVAQYGAGLTPRGKMTGYAIPTPDGEMLVATMGDTLAAGLLLTDGGTIIEARMSPSPGSRIIDSVMLPPPPAPDGGTEPVAFGYVLTNNSLARITALNAHRWRSVPVEIAYDEADAVAVWADGPRGRVGYDDGVVFSLPSLVPIAPRLPGVKEKVRSYAELCGQGFALSNQNNLYRLVPSPSGGIGTWKREDLAGLGGPAFDPAEATLYSNGDELYLLGTYGTVSRLTISGGCR